MMMTAAKNSTPPRVLFVCLGNICRSPAAEVVCRALARQAGIAMELDSCGTASYHVGSRPDARMRAALSKMGYGDDGHRARQFKRSDFERFDVIIAQDEENRRDILSLAQSGEERARVHAMSEWFPSEWAAKYAAVPDPYYGGQQGFEEVIHLLEASCRQLLASHQALRGPCKIRRDEFWK